MLKKSKVALLIFLLLGLLFACNSEAKKDNTNEVISLQYDEVGDFSEGLAAVKKGDKWGYIDKYGIEVLPFKYHSAYSFKDGLAYIVYEDDGKFESGFIDKSGKIVIKPSPQYFHYPYQFSEGLIEFTESGKDGFGYMDTKGNVIISCKYKFARPFSEGIAVVQFDDGLWG